MTEIISALDKVSDTDLEKVNDEIANSEKRLEALKAIRKVIEIRLNGPKPKKVGFTRNPELLEKYRKDAAFALLKGPKKAAVLGEECGIPPKKIPSVLAHSWFAKTEQGVQVTTEGRRAVG